MPTELDPRCEPVEGPEALNYQETDQETERLLTFVSFGEVASFPDDLVTLPTLRIGLSGAQPYARRYELPYSIVSDRAPRKEGHLVLLLDNTDSGE